MKIVAHFCILLTVICKTSLAMAHDDGFSHGSSFSQVCMEPLKPFVSSYVEENAIEELRQDFELYFHDVEIYLNCLNKEAYRIRLEAERATYEMNNVFKQFPDKNSNTPQAVGHPPMINSGHLNLDYKGVGG